MVLKSGCKYKQANPEHCYFHMTSLDVCFLCANFLLLTGFIQLSAIKLVLKMHSITEVVKSYLIGPLDIREELGKLYQLKDELVMELEHHMRWKSPISTERVLALLVKNGREIKELETWTEELQVCEAMFLSLSNFSFFAH